MDVLNSFSTSFLPTCVHKWDAPYRSHFEVSPASVYSSSAYFVASITAVVTSRCFLFLFDSIHYRLNFMPSDFSQSIFAKPSFTETIPLVIPLSLGATFADRFFNFTEDLNGAIQLKSDMFHVYGVAGFLLTAAIIHLVGISCFGFAIRTLWPPIFPVISSVLMYSFEEQALRKKIDFICDNCSEQELPSSTYKTMFYRDIPPTLAFINSKTQISMNLFRYFKISNEVDVNSARRRIDREINNLSLNEASWLLIDLLRTDPSMVQREISDQEILSKLINRILEKTQSKNCFDQQRKEFKVLYKKSK